MWRKMHACVSLLGPLHLRLEFLLLTVPWFGNFGMRGMVWDVLRTFMTADIWASELPWPEYIQSVAAFFVKMCDAFVSVC